MATREKDPLAVELGRRGGLRKSQAKTWAAQENGALGGRPRGGRNAWGDADVEARVKALHKVKDDETDTTNTAPVVAPGKD